MSNKKFNPLYFLALIPIGMFGILGAIFESFRGEALSGFLWGIAIGFGIMVVSLIGIFGWEWLKKQMEKGKLFPYITLAVIASIIISTIFATSLGKPSCEEYDNSGEPYQSCTQYADDGYEATSDQKWAKFWGTLPVTIVITSLIATLVHHNIHKKGEK
ncbi:MAG TPA: hypothetical protein PLZ58_00440 [Candidatus Saccharibacteria bacterium]|nr:hypothetical protein [Candidatus Saccharibacteria bacterium]HRQ07212.1 hypothetical protein [Candidatus Saccharibacteria bacterium]